MNCHSTFVRLLFAVTFAATVPACGRDSAPTAPSAAPGQAARLDDRHGSNRGPGTGSQDADDNRDNDDNDDDNGQVEVKGTIAAGSLAGACAANTLSFRVGSTAVRTNASTQFEDTSCNSLKVGDSVEVNGSRQPDSAVLAARVEKRK